MKHDMGNHYNLVLSDEELKIVTQYMAKHKYTSVHDAIIKMIREIESSRSPEAEELAKSIKNWNRQSIHWLKKDIENLKSWCGEFGEDWQDYVNPDEIPTVSVKRFGGRYLNPHGTVWACDKYGRCLVGDDLRVMIAEDLK